MAIPPLDLSQWLDRHGDLPLPPNAPLGDAPQWRGETAVCYAFSRPLSETSFIAAVRQTMGDLWGAVHKRLDAIDLARDCNVALPAIRFQNSPEGYRLRAQTMITWSGPVEDHAIADANGEFEIDLATD